MTDGLAVLGGWVLLLLLLAVLTVVVVRGRNR
jgi:hypothetical protein